MTSEKTALLKKTLLAHKEKEKKHFLEWDQLRTKLGLAGRNKFGLTATSTREELENAIEPYLDEELVLLKKGDFLYFAFNIPREELAYEIVSEKNARLKHLFLAHQEKEKKKYIDRESLLKQLGKDGLKLFGLKAKSSAGDVKSKIEPFLGSNLMLCEADGQLVLAFPMSLDALRKELDSEKTDYLEKMLAKYRAKEKKSYMPLKLDAVSRKIFGLTAKATLPETKKALEPFLGANLVFRVKKKSGKDVFYLVANMSPQELLLETIPNFKSPKDYLKKLAGDFPLENRDFVTLFNQLLAMGQIAVAKVDEKYSITSVRIGGVSASPGRVAEPPPTASPASDRALFQAAFEKLDQGRIYVRICNMRRELAWSVERFNLMLRKLRADGTIQLHAGDISTLTEADVNLSYTDENNFFYATLTWKKR